MTMFCDCGNPEAHRGEHIPKPVTDTPLTPDTVRALCDAADEVERLRAAVVERDTRLAETIRYHDARVNRADEATDASRTAHAALIADLRALRPVQHVCSDGVWLRYADVRDLADRHAPTTGETP